MKALILFKEKDCAWTRSFFPDHHSAMVPVCNKPLLEYLVDFVMLNGCQELRILMEEPSSDVENYFNSGDRWGLRISYGVCSPMDSLKRTLEKNSTFCSSTPLVIIDGYLFIHYDKSDDYHTWMETEKKNALYPCDTGSLIYLQDMANVDELVETSKKSKLDFTALQTANDFFKTGMRILTDGQSHYVLPGYGVEKGVLIGRNVEIGRDVKITLPILIGDNVRLLGQARIGPNVAIGDNVIIDDNTQVSESIIFTDSYIGRGLFINKKIVDGPRVISPEEGESLQIKDRFLFSAMEEKKVLSPIRYLLGLLGAICIIIAQTIPYFILSGLRKIFGNWKTKTHSCYLGGNKKNTDFLFILIDPDTFLGQLFGWLSLDKYPLLFGVVKGELALVGNRLLPVNEENRQIIDDFPEYSPGAFFYGENEDILPGSQEDEVTQRFFIANKSFKQDFFMLLKIILSRLAGKNDTIN